MLPVCIRIAQGIKKTMLTAQQVAHFDTFGFLFFKQLFSAEEMAAYVAQIKQHTRRTRNMMHTWTTQGFEAFSAGTCSHAGHNLYVSHAGILQRIHQYDFDQKGYLYLVFCNSQGNLEMPPAGVYRDPLGQLQYFKLPADGARSGAVLDLRRRATRPGLRLPAGRRRAGVFVDLLGGRARFLRRTAHRPVHFPSLRRGGG
jgi:hypothetical protein